MPPMEPTPNPANRELADALQHLANAELHIGAGQFRALVEIQRRSTLMLLAAGRQAAMEFAEKLDLQSIQFLLLLTGERQSIDAVQQVLAGHEFTITINGSNCDAFGCEDVHAFDTLFTSVIHPALLGLGLSRHLRISNNDQAMTIKVLSR